MKKYMGRLAVASLMVAGAVHGTGSDHARRAVDAAGGGTTVLALDAIHVRGHFELIDGETARTGRHETLLVVPDRVRQVRHFDDGGTRMVRLLDRDRGLATSNEMTMELDGAFLSELRQYAGSQYLSLLHGLARGTLALTDGPSPPKAHEGWQWRASALEGRAIWLAFENATGRLIATEFAMDVAESPTAERYRQIFSDFRDVAGVQLPFAIHSFVEGRPFTRRIQDEAMKIGTVDDQWFTEVGEVTYAHLE